MRVPMNSVEEVPQPRTVTGPRSAQRGSYLGFEAYDGADEVDDGDSDDDGNAQRGRAPKGNSHLGKLQKLDLQAMNY
jgi:hypothetical protein